MIIAGGFIPPVFYFPGNLTFIVMITSKMVKLN
jgi:hypothetical protein